MIVGGFGGKYFDESLEFNPNKNTVKHTSNKLPQTVFPFAVPTIGSPQKNELITVDWTTFTVFRFSNSVWQKGIALKKWATALKIASKPLTTTQSWIKLLYINDSKKID